MTHRIFPFLLASVLASDALAAARNLVPADPGKSPNYWCTWSAQSYMQGQGAKANDPLLYQVTSIDKLKRKLYENATP